MKFIKNSFKDHPIMGIGSIMFFIYIIGFLLLPVFYDDPEDVPSFISVLLVFVLLYSAITISIGGFFYIGNKVGANSFRSRLNTYTKGFLNEIKSPIFIGILAVSMIAIFVAFIFGIS